MIPPDQEIYEVEKRIAERRHRVEAAARNAGRQALRTLTSPWVLAGAGVLGFLAAGGIKRKHEPTGGPAVSQETKEKAKGGAIAGLGMAALTWLIKAQFGSPVAMAQYFLAKLKKEDRAQPSPTGDRTPVTTRR